MKLSVCILSIVGIASIPAVAVAEDFSVTKARAEAELKEKAGEVATACGAKVQTKVDWSKLTESVASNYSISSYCGNPLDALVDLCAGAASKAYIKKKVKKLTCTFGGVGKRALNVKGGAMTFVLDFDAGNNEEFAKKELIKKL
ncbi:MAG: hypothetical protein AAFZ38_09465 [Myxococcota bacterium]